MQGSFCRSHNSDKGSSRETKIELVLYKDLSGCCHIKPINSPCKVSTVPLESEYWRHCSPYRHFVIHPGTWLSVWGCCIINPQPLIQYWKYFVHILSTFWIIYYLGFDAKPTVLSALFPLSLCCHLSGPHLTSFPIVHTLWCFKHTLMTFMPLCVSSPHSFTCPVRTLHQKIASLHPLKDVEACARS